MAERARRPTKLRTMWVTCVVGALGAPLSHAALKSPPSPPLRAEACDQGLVEHMPVRAVDAPGGGEFARRVQSLSGPARDDAIRSQLLAGNLPGFLRHLVPVTLTAAGSPRVLTVCVLPDYLAVGTDRDFLFVPMGLRAALDVARRFGFELPTPKVVDAIYDEATVRLHPQPLPAGDRMRGTPYLVRHNEMIGEQRAEAGGTLGALTAGHKKDLVLTRLLWQVPGRVAIYGWHRGFGDPIQPLSTVHGARYADYSHGIRLISNTVYVNGVRQDIADVLAEPALAGLLSKEGPLPRLPARLVALRATLEDR